MTVASDRRLDFDGPAPASAPSARLPHPRARVRRLHSVLAPLLCLGSVPVLLALLTAVAEAQSIRGTVRDEVSGRPLPGAAVFLTDVDGAVRAVARSGAAGEYLLQSTAGDTVRVRAERHGYTTMQTRPWVLAQQSVLDLDIHLKPEPVMLDTLTITGAWRSRNRAGFERRRRMEIFGRFADAERLSRVRSPLASQRLAAVIPGLLVAPDGTVRVRKRGVSPSGFPTCQPRFYIDGVRFPGDMPVDALVQGNTIGAVEYYSNPQQAPAEYSMGMDQLSSTPPGLGGNVTTRTRLGPPCAIIVIWTEVGFGDSG